MTEPDSAFAKALEDITGGIKIWPMWGFMGWMDIKQRYRRSVLGPFWLTLSMSIMIGSLGILYAALFKIPIHDYLPFLCISLLVWTFISTVIMEACTAFVVAEHLIKQIKLPFTVHIYRTIWRNLIIFGHNLIVYIIVAVIFNIWPGINGLLFLPGLVLVLLNVLWIGLILSMVCARYYDITPTVASLIQVIFFLTPVIWKPELLGDNIKFAQLNPFYAFIEILRAPLLGSLPPASTWMMAFTSAVLGTSFAFLFFARFRKRVAYWL